MTFDPPTRILVVQNDQTCPLGGFADTFERGRVEVDVRRGFAPDDIPARASGFDGIIVLGGAMGANDGARFPWLAAVQHLIRDAAGEDVPLLGICLGMQLAAVALGGEVTANPNGRAAGLVPVGAAPDTDPLLGGLAPASAIQWNDDIVSRLPAGSSLLAASPDGTPQAIRFGPRAWGVQYHPEATAAIFRSWLDEEAAAGTVADGAAGTAASTAAWRAVDAAGEQLRVLADAVAGRFLNLCRVARAAA
jgi:GMP synthase (glutamine-hydrolysing)